MGIVTYAVVNLLFILLALMVSWRWIMRTQRHFMIITLHLLGMTLIFDSLIILAGIVAYNSSKLFGIYLGLAPIEDFAYAIVAAMIVPALWHIFSKKKKEE